MCDLRQELFKTGPKTLFLLLAMAVLSGCTFKFDLTSQRTALENQVMGSYKELEDDLVLVSSVRASQNAAAADAMPESQRLALLARQNQDFNRDDVDELKTKELLGETNQGTLVLLPQSVSQAAKASQRDQQLGRTLVDEENRDRARIWQRIIDGNDNLSAKDLPDVRRTYAKMQRAAAAAGQWVQNDAGQWERKQQ